MELILYNIYKIFELSAIGRIVIRNTKLEVTRYLPFDEYGIGINTIKVFFINIIKSILIFLISIIISGFDKKYVIVATIVSIVYYRDNFIKWKRRREYIIIRQLSAYINELRHEYYRINDVEEAFLIAFKSAGEELKLHLGIIEEYLESSKIPEHYIVYTPSKFILIFISICQTAINYGDDGMDFISNIDELQKNIDIDLLKLEKEKSIFFSTFFVLSFSIICLPLMEGWGVLQVRELSSFYEGYVGSIARIACVSIFLIISILFERLQIYKEDTRLLTEILSENNGVSLFLERVIKKFPLKDEKLEKIFIDCFPEKSYVSFALNRIIYFLWSLSFVILWNLYYRKGITYLFIGILISIAISYLPYLSIVVDGIFYTSRLEEEIGEVRIMVLALSRAKNITAEEILLRIEDFTFYLRDGISKCIDEGLGDVASLNDIRRRWLNTSFINILDDLIASDKIGIKEAFNDIFSRKDFYLAKRKQEHEILIQKKEAVLNTIIYLPFMVSVGIYMVAPFLYVSLTNLIEVTRGFR